MAKQFFKDLPDTTTPLTASRLNGLLDGEEALGNLLVDGIKTKNIFDGLLEQGGFYTDGSKSSGASMYRSANKITVQPNTTYTTSINGTAQQYVMFYYNANNVFLSSGDNRTGTFTTPNDCYYVNFRCYTADYTTNFNTLKVQVELGSSATTYSKFQELDIDNVKNKEIVVGKIRSKNMLDVRGIEQKTNNGVTCTYDSSTNIITLNGTVTSNTQANFYIPSAVGMKLKRLTNYTTSVFYIGGTASGGNLKFFAQDANNNFEGIQMEFGGSNINSTLQFDNDLTVSSGYCLIRAYSGQVLSNLKFKIQVEESPTTTDYMPFQELNYKPVILFNNPDGLFDDITLSDSKVNYSKLEVFYLDDQNFQNCMIIDTSGNPFQLQFIKSGANRGSLYLIATRMYWNSNTVLKRGVTTIYNIVNGTVTENTTADVLKITKIIAYK